MFNRNTITIAILAIISGFVILGYYSAWKRYQDTIRDAAYWRADSFKTDTVYLEKPYQVLIPYKEVVPPKKITVYKYTEPTLYLKIQDSLLMIIDSLENRPPIIIKPQFLTQYPEAPKLLGASFGKDSISLDLLNISGSIHREDYPVNYNVFKYQYVNNSFRAMELPARLDINLPKKGNIISYSGTYLYYDHDMLQAEHQLSATSGFDIWKIRAMGWGQYRIKDQAKLSGGIRVGFRLF